MLARDRGRLARRRAARRRVAARLGRAGGDRRLPIDREATARGARASRGVDRATASTRSAIATSRSSWSSACALLMAHLSRLGEELVLWATQEFGFVRLPRGLLLGLSLMPQKVNPDIAELVRAKAGARDRRSGRAAHDHQGAAARLQQGSAGDAGAALRRGRDGDRCALRTMAGLIAAPRSTSSGMRARGRTRATCWRPSSPTSWRRAGVPFRAGARGGGRAGAHGERARRRARPS